MTEESPRDINNDLHQIVANGQVIYEGKDWPQAFLDAGRNPAYQEIVHLINGKPTARMGSMLVPSWFESEVHC